jgi:hypothetical protein
MSEAVDSRQLTAVEARALIDDMKRTVRTGYDQYLRAWTGRAWTALGYESWDDLCAVEFAETRMLQLPRDDRREKVAELRSAGMSTRAIGSAIGASDATVRRDLSGASDDAPEPPPVTGLDGKTYPQPQPGPPEEQAVENQRPAPDPDPGNQPAREAKTVPDAKRPPITTSFKAAALDATKAVARLHRLTEDDRFPKYAEQVAAVHRGDLDRAAEALAGVLGRLPNQH